MWVQTLVWRRSFQARGAVVGFHFDHETRKRLSRTVDCPHTRCSNSGEARPRDGGDGLRGFGTCLIFWISSVEGSQHADAPHALALLRARRERPRGCRAAEQRDELAPFHCPIPPVPPTERIAHLGTADCCIHPPGRNEMIAITPPIIFSKEVAQKQATPFPRQDLLTARYRF